MPPGRSACYCICMRFSAPASHSWRSGGYLFRPPRDGGRFPDDRLLHSHTTSIARPTMAHLLLRISIPHGAGGISASRAVSRFLAALPARVRALFSTVISQGLTWLLDWRFDIRCGLRRSAFACFLVSARARRRSLGIDFSPFLSIDSARSKLP